MSASPFAPDRDSGGSSGIITVCKNGDVILVVGPDKERIQVASEFLKHISPVLKAMLDGPMMEGESLRSRNDAPVEVTLPDDDPRTMAQVLKILYGAGNSVEEAQPKDIKEIAILADKYDMGDHLMYFGAHWFRTPESYAGQSDSMWDIAIAAYMLGLDWAFFEITEIMARYECSFLKYAMLLPDQILGLRLGMAIAETRALRSRTGICLHCFIRAEESFFQQRTDFDNPDWHINRYRN